MRVLIVALFVAALAACAAGPRGNSAVPAPAKSVDLQRYKGLWYEFARYENRFEEGCEAVTAEYAAKVSLDGLAHNKLRVVPGLPAKFMSVTNQFTPRGIIAPIVGRVYRQLAGG